MDERKVVIPDGVPEEWPASAADAPPTACACATPTPQVRAEHKGAARTYCARCGLPIRIDFDRR